MNDQKNSNSSELIKKFSDISLADLALVGGKNASLGELFSQLTSKGINIPDGFATTSHAYRKFLQENNILPELTKIVAALDRNNFSNLKETGAKARQLILNGQFSEQLKNVTF
mgnify:CR=1 FL=1